MVDSIRYDQPLRHISLLRSSVIKHASYYKHRTPTEFASKFVIAKKAHIKTNCPGQKQAASPAHVRQANRQAKKEHHQTRKETESRHA